MDKSMHTLPIYPIYSRLPWMSSQNGWRHFNVSVPSREKLVFHTEINNKTYLKLLVSCDIASSS